MWLVTAAFSCLCHVQHADDFMPLLFQGLTKSKNATIWSCVYPGAFPLLQPAAAWEYVQQRSISLLKCPCRGGGITAMVLNTWKGNLLHPSCTKEREEDAPLIFHSNTHQYIQYMRRRPRRAMQGNGGSVSSSTSPAACWRLPCSRCCSSSRPLGFHERCGVPAVSSL